MEKIVANKIRGRRRHRLSMAKMKKQEKNPGQQYSWPTQTRSLWYEKKQEKEDPN